eukprot:360675-Chlamydomonas_euryale.AAC.3
MGCTEPHGTHGGEWAVVPSPAQAASSDQAALPPPQPAGPPHTPATSKECGPCDGLGKPSSHMRASASPHVPHIVMALGSLRLTCVHQLPHMFPTL